LSTSRSFSDGEPEELPSWKTSTLSPDPDALPTYPLNCEEPGITTDGIDTDDLALAVTIEERDGTVAEFRVPVRG